MIRLTFKGIVGPGGPYDDYVEAEDYPALVDKWRHRRFPMDDGIRFRESQLLFVGSDLALPIADEDFVREIVRLRPTFLELDDDADPLDPG